MIGRSVAAGLMRLAGWRVEGEPVVGGPVLMVGAPHTSNVDFLVFLLGAAAHGVSLKFLMKREAFRPPLGGLMRAVGGVPVDRGSAGGVVRSSVRYLQEQSGILGILPKGTRRFAPEWRPGFYHMARMAQVPVVLVSADYRRKLVRFSAPLRIGDDVHTEMALIRAFFDGVVGRHAANTDVVELAMERKQPVDPSADQPA